MDYDSLSCSLVVCRPIAGYINFCPSPFADLTDDGAIALGIHEVMHAIVSCF